MHNRSSSPWIINLLFFLCCFCFVSGDLLYSAPPKPSSASSKHLSNSMIRGSRGQHHRSRRHHQAAAGGSVNLTSSSSTLSSMSNCNNDRESSRELIRNKDKETYDNPHHLQFNIKSGKSQPPSHRATWWRVKWRYFILLSFPLPLCTNYNFFPAFFSTSLQVAVTVERSGLYFEQSKEFFFCKLPALYYAKCKSPWNCN